MRIILCFLLAVVAAPAWAEWEKVVRTDAATIYVDPASIRKDGNFRKVWEIQDLSQRNEVGTMSYRSLVEYDCKEERYRLLAGSSHSEPMAGGKALFSTDRGGQWSFIPPNTVGDAILKLVCAK